MGAGPSVIRDGGIYKMWYSKEDDIFYAISTDGTAWTIQNSGSPVIEDAGYCSVIKNDNLYEIWYENSTTDGIGYAYSTDGINWTQYDNNPVLIADESWEDREIGDPSVIKDGTTYKIWYCGDNGIGYATDDSSPTVTTGWATMVHVSSATLNGIVNPDGLNTTYYFEYGTTTGYGSETLHENAGSGMSNISVSAHITGLVADTTYHFRLVAENSAGISYGSDRTFIATERKEIALVTLQGSGEVAFISIENAKVLKTVGLLGASFPSRIAITPDGKMAIVTSYSGYVCFIDIAKMECVKSLKFLCGPEQYGLTLVPNEFNDVYVTPNGKTALVTEANENGQLFFIDIQTMEFSGEPLRIGDDPATVIVNSSGSEAYLLDKEAGDVYIVNLSQGTYVTISQPVGTDEIEDFFITPDESRAMFIDDYNGIYLIDINTWNILDTKYINDDRFTELGQVAVSPDGTVAIVTSGTDQSIIFVTVNQTSLTIEETIDAGGSADGVAFTKNGKTAVVAIGNTNLVKIIDIENRQVRATVDANLGLAPSGVAIVEIGEEPPEYIPVSISNLSASPATGVLPLDVTFNIIASGGSGNYTYIWDFGDDQTSDEQNPAHTFNDVGTYTINVVVTDTNDDSNSSTGQLEIVVLEKPAVFIPVGISNLSASPTSGIAPLDVTFSVTLVGGSGTYSYEWDFNNDGTIDSTNQNPTYTYNDEGTYTVTINVTDENDLNNSCTGQLTIIVIGQPVSINVSLNAEPATGAAPLEVTFTAEVSGDSPPYTVTWDFGDGTGTTQDINNNTAVVSHTYESAGSYQTWVEVLSENAGNGAVERTRVSIGISSSRNILGDTTKDTDDGVSCFIDTMAYGH